MVETVVGLLLRLDQYDCVENGPTFQEALNDVVVWSKNPPS